MDIYQITIKTEKELIADGWKKYPISSDLPYFIKDTVGAAGEIYESCQITPFMSRMLGRVLLVKYDSLGELSKLKWYTDTAKDGFFWREDMISQIIKIA